MAVFSTYFGFMPNRVVPTVALRRLRSLANFCHINWTRRGAKMGLLLERRHEQSLGILPVSVVS